MSDKVTFKLFEIKSELAANSLRLNNLYEEAKEGDRMKDGDISLLVGDVEHHIRCAINKIEAIGSKLKEGYDDFT